MIRLFHMLCLAQSHHLLLLVEVLHLELISEFKDLLCFALSLRGSTDLLSETFVQLFEIFLFLGAGHEEEGRQLWVFFFEYFSVLGGKHLYVIRNCKIFLLALQIQNSLFLLFLHLYVLILFLLLVLLVVLGRWSYWL